MIVNSESLGILGTDIDLIYDLGIEQHRLGKFDLVLKPVEEASLQVSAPADQVPDRRLSGDARVHLQRPALHDWPAGDDERGLHDLQLRLRVRLPALPARLRRRRLNMKLTNVDVELQSPIGRNSSQQSAPIPAFSFAGRGYITTNLSIDSEFTFFRIPEHRGTARRRRQLQRLRPARHLQLQQLRRRAAGLAQDDDLLRGRPRHRRPEVHGAVFRRGGPVLEARG